MSPSVHSPTVSIVGGKTVGFFYQHEARAIAMGLTAVAYREVAQIQPRDLVAKQFGSGSLEAKRARSPSYMHAVACFNERVRWIQAVILCEDVGFPGQRSSAIAFFIDVGCECVQLGNYQTALEVVSALSAPSIALISNNMAVVSERARQKFEGLQVLLAQENHFENYRCHYQSACVRPHVPLLPVITQDLMRLEEGSKTYHPSNPRLIGIQKFSKIYTCIESFGRCRKNPYEVVYVAPVGGKRRPRGSNASEASRTSNGSGSSGSATGEKSASTVTTSRELEFVLTHWLYPPPPAMALYKTAARVLKKESQNLVATLDFLGL